MASPGDLPGLGRGPQLSPHGLALCTLTPAPVSYRVFAARSCFAPTNAASSSSTRSWIMCLSHSSALALRCNRARNVARAARSAGRETEAGLVLRTRIGFSQAESSLACATISWSISFSESFFLALPRMLILHIFANWHHPRAAWRHRLQERDGRSHWKELYAAPLRLSRRMLVMRDRCTPVAKHAGDPRPVRGQGRACPAGLPGLRRRRNPPGSPVGIRGRGIVAQPRGLGRRGGPPPRPRSLPGR